MQMEAPKESMYGGARALRWNAAPAYRASPQDRVSRVAEV
jgi:hypothetical protein